MSSVIEEGDEESRHWGGEPRQCVGKDGERCFRDGDRVDVDLFYSDTTLKVGGRSDGRCVESKDLPRRTRDRPACPCACSRKVVPNVHVGSSCAKIAHDKIEVKNIAKER